MHQRASIEFIPGRPYYEGELLTRVDDIYVGGRLVGTRTCVTPPGEKECRRIHLEIPSIGYERDLSRLTLGSQLESEAVREVESFAPSIERKLA